MTIGAACPVRRIKGRRTNFENPQGERRLGRLGGYAGVMESGLDIRIREADRGDTRFLAWVMQEAARSHLPKGIFDVLVPDDVRRIDFLDALLSTETRSFGHHAGFLIAEIDGRAAAGLSGYEPRLMYGEPFAQAIGEAMDRQGWTPSERAEFGERMLSVMAGMPSPPEDRWVVEWVATSPEFRGRGIVHTLLLEILDRGRDAGFDKAQIGYFLGNIRAARSYERVGFRCVDEWRSPVWEEALGSPGVATMHLDL